jgi:hypothetical protein
MLIYAMVARGTTVVAEQTAYEGNFRDIAAQCLQRLPFARDDRFTYACDGHTFTFLVHQGYGMILTSCVFFSTKVCSEVNEHVQVVFLLHKSGISLVEWTSRLGRLRRIRMNNQYELVHSHRGISSIGIPPLLARYSLPQSSVHASIQSLFLLPCFPNFVHITHTTESVSMQHSASSRQRRLGVRSLWPSWR